MRGENYRYLPADALKVIKTKVLKKKMWNHFLLGFQDQAQTGGITAMPLALQAV